MTTDPLPGTLDEVRIRCAEVTEGGRSVAVDGERLVTLASEAAHSLRADTPEATTAADPWAVPADDPETAAGTVLALASVCFGSGYHPVMRKRPGLSGATSTAACLRDWLARSGSCDPGILAGVTPTTAAAVFDQPPGRDAGVDDLVAAYAGALSALGQAVVDRAGGSWVRFVGQADGSPDRMVDLLRSVAPFDDVAPWRGGVVPFHKRAQLAVADLARTFGGRGPGAFEDLHRLTAFADNLVPHVLRIDGVLRYAPQLARRIDHGEELAWGSEEEVEIRAAAVIVTDRLVAALAEQGRPARAMDVDAWLWRRGAGVRYKAVPRHRTRCTAY